ncbi:malonyl CoA-ACP transacylase [Candidatus Mycobacterium wuenschmannii]|uniref:Malonyl CoA-ACP transacylase n=1 Tax=Candidatus Mycobacterium wuenschmannii TaxID=3027808 RepID=A0ABY8VV76_9MYCO|nr:malonyl CoA-ACP transacylase [Candidatus Mycobacterium wuenschmannii]WIM87508.1 malonyl CoA-ACP transacylase [Candidatus Mycobacterium wuenschmannii]
MNIAVVDGIPIPVDEVDVREARLRGGSMASALPMPGTSEGRQLRRWLTQLIVTERVVAVEAAARGLTVDGVPTEDDLLPDITARLEIGSIAAAALGDVRARALFVVITADVRVGDDEIAAYHDRNPLRFGDCRRENYGWRAPAVVVPPFAVVRPLIAEHLLAAAHRRAFRVWLDRRRADLVQLSPGYEHPGDPRQPDNTHRH